MIIIVIINLISGINTYYWAKTIILKNIYLINFYLIMMFGQSECFGKIKNEIKQKSKLHIDFIFMINAISTNIKSSSFYWKR